MAAAHRELGDTSCTLEKVNPAGGLNLTVEFPRGFQPKTLITDSQLPPQLGNLKITNIQGDIDRLITKFDKHAQNPDLHALFEKRLNTLSHSDGKLDEPGQAFIESLNASLEGGKTPSQAGKVVADALTELQKEHRFSNWSAKADELNESQRALLGVAASMSRMFEDPKAKEAFVNAFNDETTSLWHKNNKLFGNDKADGQPVFPVMAVDELGPQVVMIHNNSVVRVLN